MPDPFAIDPATIRRAEQLQAANQQRQAQQQRQRKDADATKRLDAMSAGYFAAPAADGVNVIAGTR